MPAYAIFSVQDFVMDEFFQHWVLNPDDHEAGAFWETWLKENPGRKQEIEEAREILLGIRFSNYSLNREGVSGLWERIRESRGTDKLDTHFISRRKVWIMAATVTAIVCLAGAFWLFQNPMHEYVTAYGETKNIVLPDSSVVVLNANSILRFPRDWEQRPVRELWVDGEAFFSVIHKKNNQPFKVYTDEGVTVEVLGTVFNVYNRHRETKVVLTSGKIQLQLPSSLNDEKIMMEPGEMVEFRERKYTKHWVDPTHYSAWTMSRLELNHTSLQEMIQMVQDNYGLRIEVSDRELLKQTVSGSMPYGDANSLLQQVAKSFQLTVRREDNVFHLEENIE